MPSLADSSPPEAVVSKTSSSVAVHTGEHLFTIFRHSRIKGSNTCLTSKRFRVGGHDWVIDYYPNGDSRIADGQFTSVFLMLMTACQCEVKLSYTFCLHDPAAPLTGEKHKFGHTIKFSSEGDSSGTHKFVSKADLAASGCIKDDCLVIKCTIDVIDDSDDSSLIVPPSELSKDLHNLLQRGFRADLTVVVGKYYKSFKVHGCILAARSPVFQAQLCGSMMESTESSIHIEGMSAKAFEVLLYYMYNDSLPGFMDESTKEATNMATHLLVAADRYAMERLKLMCECKLSKVVAMNTVGSILNLAEQYSCHQLKARCLKYVGKNSGRLQAIEDAGGFVQLKHNHPLLARDILGKPGCKKNKNKKKKKKGGKARNK
ncbi:BTB/POZ and MATH domain-containing protein 1-like [Triticum aestivum]|nr:BTB/POZ and MATH domain-containing protein 1-like [Aegilops tauschii subsp. strangulata]XP_044416312.1 BTB/POZ and MATH domain-containing protein 1-like [Triticum aestivum]